jgi:hypothetical protein
MAVGLGGLKIRINSSPMIAANSYGVNRFISIEFPQCKLGIPHNFFWFLMNAKVDPLKYSTD